MTNDSVQQCHPDSADNKAGSSLWLQHICLIASVWLQWLEGKWGAAVGRRVSPFVRAAGLLVFPSFTMFSLTAFIHISHTRNGATGVSSTLFTVKTVEDVPKPLMHTFNKKKWNGVQQRELVSCLYWSHMPGVIKTVQRRGSVNILQLARALWKTCFLCIHHFPALLQIQKLKSQRHVVMRKYDFSIEHRVDFSACLLEKRWFCTQLSDWGKLLEEAEGLTKANINIFILTWTQRRDPPCPPQSFCHICYS